MGTYTHEYSEFPNRMYSVHNFLDLKDAPQNVLDVVMQIKTHILNNEYSAAAELLNQYKSMLASYMVDATYLNTIDEELRNLEIYTKTKKQSLYYQEEKPAGVVGDIWISS